MTSQRKREKDPGCQRYRSTDTQERGSTCRLPFQDRSGVIRPHECRGESLHTHYSPHRTQSLRRTRDRGRQNHHEPHGNAKRRGRMESHRSRKIQPSNLAPTLGRDEAAYADDDREESDEQRGNPHTLLCDSTRNPGHGRLERVPVVVVL